MADDDETPAAAASIVPTPSFGADDTSDFFEVKIPDVLGSGEDSESEDPDDDWMKIKGWYNELKFYSKIFQFFGETIKEKESMYGWWIIIISSFSSFATLFNVEPFQFSEKQVLRYEWAMSIFLSFLSISTTLIASWVKKKAYVTRIQAIDKRISRLEKFLGRLDYQFRLVPRNKREDYFKFITDMRDEYNDLSIYSHLISPSEFSFTVYTITRYNAPTVRGSWPWYDTETGRARRDYARHIIDTYDSQYSWASWCKSLCCRQKVSDMSNPLLNENV